MASASGEAANTVAASPDAPYVLAEYAGQVLWLTLNRPAQRNPLSSGMIQALAAAIAAAGADPGVRVIVIASTGPVFSAGHDLREMGRREGETEQERAARIRGILEACAQMMLAIVHSPRAVIACVEGVATAAGCQLVSACDLALASERAQFCTPGVNIGTFCTTPLVGIGRNMQRKHAMEMALSGDLMSAQDAVRFGLVNQALPAAEVRAAVAALAAKIAGKSAAAIRAGKETFYRQIDMPLEQAFGYATDAMVQGLISPDAEEGSRAFLEKRSPRWGDA